VEYRFVASQTDQQNVTLEYIRQLEQQRQIQFPQVLTEYYQRYNMAPMKEVSFERLGITFYMSCIAPLCYGTMPVEKQLQYNDKNAYIPDTWIPFADDQEGDHFFWDTETGAVSYVCRENVENPIPICDSVEEFFELLNDSCE